MQFCVFSKHFQALDFRSLGKALKTLGFEGVHLTVRGGGHIQPVEAKEKLPLAKDILETASKLGIKYFKLGCYLYEGFGGLKKSLMEANANT